jgi:superoxide reductase
MTQLKQVYKCNVCGNIVEVLHAGAGEPVCCGQPMQLLQEKTQDEGLEKHVPVVEKTEKGFKVKVGLVAHPMEEKHFIEWISVEVAGKQGRKFLKPGETPEAEFFYPINDITEVKAREYCNLHGLWRSA